MQVQRNMETGTAVLDQGKLKSLRRQRGLSQEMLAQLCSEARLCISLASIKRAEAGKRVLYRTARHMATFYGVHLAALLKDDGGKPSGPEMNEGNILCVAITQPHDRNLLFEILRDEIEKFGGRVDRL